MGDPILLSVRSGLRTSISQPQDLDQVTQPFLAWVSSSVERESSQHQPRRAVKITREALNIWNGVWYLEVLVYETPLPGS